MFSVIIIILVAIVVGADALCNLSAASYVYPILACLLFLLDGLNTLTGHLDLILYFDTTLPTEFILFHLNLLQHIFNIYGCRILPFSR